MIESERREREGKSEDRIPAATSRLQFDAEGRV